MDLEKVKTGIDIVYLLIGGGVGVITWTIAVVWKIQSFVKKLIEDHDGTLIPKIDTLIDAKLGRASKIEQEKRDLRKDKYEIELNTLNKKADGCSDKIISIESEIKDKNGITDRLKDLENECKNLRERI